MNDPKRCETDRDVYVYRDNIPINSDEKVSKWDKIFIFLCIFHQLKHSSKFDFHIFKAFFSQSFLVFVQFLVFYCNLFGDKIEIRFRLIFFYLKLITLNIIIAQNKIINEPAVVSEWSKSPSGCSFSYFEKIEVWHGCR